MGSAGRARAGAERDHRRAPDHAGPAHASLRSDCVFLHRSAPSARRRRAVPAAAAFPAGNARRHRAFDLARVLAGALPTVGVGKAGAASMDRHRQLLRLGGLVRSFAGQHSGLYHAGELAWQRAASKQLSGAGVVRVGSGFG